MRRGGANGCGPTAGYTPPARTTRGEVRAERGGVVDELPDTSNFYAALHTPLAREQVAGLYGALGWRVRKWTWTDYEMFGP